MTVGEHVVIVSRRWTDLSPYLTYEAALTRYERATVRDARIPLDAKG